MEAPYRNNNPRPDRFESTNHENNRFPYRREGEGGGRFQHDRYNNHRSTGDSDSGRPQHYTNRFGHDNERHERHPEGGSGGGGGGGGFNNRRFSNAPNPPAYNVSRVTAFKPGPPSFVPTLEEQRRSSVDLDRSTEKPNDGYPPRDRSRTMSGDYTGKPSYAFPEGDSRDLRNTNNSRLNMFDRRKGFGEDQETKAIEASRYEAELLESRKKTLNEHHQQKEQELSRYNESQHRERDNDARNRNWESGPAGHAGPGLRRNEPNANDREVWERVRLPTQPAVAPPPIDSIKQSPGAPLTSKTFGSRDVEAEHDEIAEEKSFNPHKVLVKTVSVPPASSPSVGPSKSFASLLKSYVGEAEGAKHSASHAPQHFTPEEEHLDGVVVPVGQEFSRNDTTVVVETKRKLYDPKINQLVELTASSSTDNKIPRPRALSKDEKDKVSSKFDFTTKTTDKRSQKSKPEVQEENATRWEKILLPQNTKKIPTKETDVGVVEGAVVDDSTSAAAGESHPVEMPVNAEEKEKALKKKLIAEGKQKDLQEKQKVEAERQVRVDMRRKERETRGPRTKGELYRLNEAGEIERVYTQDEKAKIAEEAERVRVVEVTTKPKDSFVENKEKTAELPTKPSVPSEKVTPVDTGKVEANKSDNPRFNKESSADKQEKSKESKEIKPPAPISKPSGPPKIPIAPPTKAWIAPKSTLEAICAIPPAIAQASFVSTASNKAKEPSNIDKKKTSEGSILTTSKEVEPIAPRDVVVSDVIVTQAPPPSLSLAPVTTVTSPVQTASMSEVSSTSTLEQINKDMKEFSLENEKEEEKLRALGSSVSLSESKPDEMKLLDTVQITSPGLQGIAASGVSTSKPGVVLSKEMSGVVPPSMLMNAHSPQQMTPTMQSLVGMGGVEDPNLFASMNPSFVGLNIPALNTPWQTAAGMGLQTDGFGQIQHMQQHHHHQQPHHLSWMASRDDANKILMHEHNLTQMLSSPQVMHHHMDPYGGYNPMGSAFPGIITGHAPSMLQDAHGNPWGYTGFATTPDGLYYAAPGHNFLTLDPRHHLMDTTSYLSGIHELNRQAAAAASFSPFGGLQHHTAASLLSTQQLSQQLSHQQMNQQLSQAHLQLSQGIQMAAPVNNLQSTTEMSIPELKDSSSATSGLMGAGANISAANESSDKVSDRSNIRNTNRQYIHPNSSLNHSSSNTGGNNEYLKREFSKYLDPKAVNNNVSRIATNVTAANNGAFSLGMGVMGGNIESGAHQNVLLGGGMLPNNLQSIPMDINNALYASPPPLVPTRPSVAAVVSPVPNADVPAIPVTMPSASNTSSANAVAPTSAVSSATTTSPQSSTVSATVATADVAAPVPKVNTAEEPTAPKLQIAPTLPVAINDGEKYIGGRQPTRRGQSSGNYGARGFGPGKKEKEDGAIMRKKDTVPVPTASNVEKVQPASSEANKSSATTEPARSVNYESTTSSPSLQAENIDERGSGYSGRGQRVRGGRESSTRPSSSRRFENSSAAHTSYPSKANSPVPSAETKLPVPTVVTTAPVVDPKPPISLVPATGGSTASANERSSGPRGPPGSGGRGGRTPRDRSDRYPPSRAVMSGPPAVPLAPGQVPTTTYTQRSSSGRDSGGRGGRGTNSGRSNNRFGPNSSSTPTPTPASN